MKLRGILRHIVHDSLHMKEAEEQVRMRCTLGVSLALELGCMGTASLHHHGACGVQGAETCRQSKWTLAC